MRRGPLEGLCRFDSCTSLHNRHAQRSESYGYVSAAMQASEHDRHSVRALTRTTSQASSNSQIQSVGTILESELCCTRSGGKGGRSPAWSFEVLQRFTSLLDCERSSRMCLQQPNHAHVSGRLQEHTQWAKELAEINKPDGGNPGSSGTVRLTLTPILSSSAQAQIVFW